MEQQLIHPKSKEVIKVIGEQVHSLKDLLLYSQDIKDQKIIVKVPRSRFLKLLSDYWALNSINVEGSLESYTKYKYYFLKDLDGNGNIFKIIQINATEVKGKCPECTCGKKRWLNPITGLCYYKEMINNNYLTKIKQYEQE